VQRTLGFGFLERVYQNALILELRREGVPAETGVPIEVRYLGEVVGVYEADVLVSGLVIVEIKAVEHVREADEVQLVNYLRATPIEVGLLINFGPRLVVKRRIFTNDRQASF
jgi:GxxExxY protein